jgi:hypothetical protein
MLRVPQLHPEHKQRVPQHHPGHKRRGRGCCAISERPRPSPVPKYPLSPIIPVHPGNSPVSPIIPVHTQKKGGGALLLNFQLGIRRRMPILSAPAKAGESKDLSRHSPLATRLSPLTPIIPEPLATAALRVVPAPIFTTTLRIHVGEPTILFREPLPASQQFPDRRAMLSSNCAPLTVDFEPLFSAKSNYSRTSAPFSAKSNHSRTYAKRGGWVP